LFKKRVYGDIPFSRANVWSFPLSPISSQFRRKEQHQCFQSIAHSRNSKLCIFRRLRTPRGGGYPSPPRKPQKVVFPCRLVVPSTDSTPDFRHGGSDQIVLHPLLVNHLFSHRCKTHNLNLRVFTSFRKIPGGAISMFIGNCGPGATLAQRDTPKAS
jgi:hypothetical protein